MIYKHTKKIQDEKIKFFQEQLLLWFKTSGREFPWRDPSLNTYQIIISEILLQRTKAETVSKFYQNFLITFPDWENLANADLKSIEEFLKPIGLFRQRAARLHKLAVYMVEKMGILPSERNKLEDISFMGQYIANAVELLIYKKNKPLLDVNMARVLERFFGSRKMADIRYDPYLQELASRVVDHKKSKELSWAILDFAALICKSRNPKCSNCIMNKLCSFTKRIVS